MFNIEYYNRYNQRIFVNSDFVGGTPATGAISDIVSVNLSPNLVLVSSGAGKIVVSAGDASKITNLNDTTGPIGAALAGKEPTLTKGNLSEVTSSVLTLTGNTGAVIGSGLGITVKQATGGQSGYLSSADWNTFNNKVSSSLANGKIWIGDGGGLPQQRTLSQDATIDNLGAVTISNSAITNIKVAAGAAISFAKMAALTASMAMVTDVSGVATTSSVTANELSKLSGINTGTSVQAQIDGKLSATITTPTLGDILYYNSGWINLPRGSTGQVLTSTATSIQWQAGASNGLPSGGTTGQYLNKIDGTNYNAQWSTLTLSKVTDISATAAQVNALGSGYYDATSSVQTQLDDKLSKFLTNNYIFVGSGGIATPFAPGSNGAVLTIVSGAPTWQVLGAGGTVTSIDVSGGTTGLTTSGGPIITSGTITLSGTLIAANGGTGQSTYTIGDILYASSTTALSKLAAGTATYVLTSNGPGSAPSWQAGGGGSSWLLASGGTLTGANTVTANTANWLTFTGTFTATASTDNLARFTGTLTANSAGGVRGVVIDPTLNASGTSSTQYALYVNPTFAGGTAPINYALGVVGDALFTSSVANQVVRFNSTGGSFSTQLIFGTDNQALIARSYSGTQGMYVYGPTSAATYTLTVTSYNSFNYTGTAGTAGTLRLNGNFVPFSAGSQAFNYLMMDGSIAPTGGTSGGVYTYVNLSPTFNFTAGTQTVYGFNYNPTLTGVTGLTNYAIRTTSGQILFANASGDTVTANTRLDVRGVSGQNIARFQSTATPTNYLNIIDSTATILQETGGTTSTVGIGTGFNTNGGIYQMRSAVGQDGLWISVNGSAQANIYYYIQTSGKVMSGNGGTISTRLTQLANQIHDYNHNLAFSSITANSFFATYSGITWSPASGSTTFNYFDISGTINSASTGAAKMYSITPTITNAGGSVIGISYAPTYTAVAGSAIGYYYNPTVTSITGSHYSFRSTSGSVYLTQPFGSSNFTGLDMDISSSYNSNGFAAGIDLRGTLTFGASWTGEYWGITAENLYNFNVAANGTIIGFNYNPTVTQIGTSKHIAFRATSGAVLIGATALTAGDIALEIGSTTKALVVSRSASDIATPVDGMLHYKTGTGLRLRDAGAWVTLGTGGSVSIGQAMAISSLRI